MLTLWEECGLDVVRLESPDEEDGLVHIFESIATMEGWRPDGGLRRWMMSSVYFALYTPAAPELFLGGLQLVLQDSEGRLPYSQIWPDLTLPSRFQSGRNNCAHVAMLGILPQYRGDSLNFWRLGAEMWRYCVAREISLLSIEVTPRVLPIYRRLGWPLQICGDLRLHWGEECYLCTLSIPEVALALLGRAENSAFYRKIILQALRVSSVDEPVGALAPT